MKDSTANSQPADVQLKSRRISEYLYQGATILAVLLVVLSAAV